MKKIRKLAAIWLSKAAIIGSRLIGKKGTAGPGKIALKVYPEILKELSRKVKKEIIVVCGSNGKTTTNNMLYHILTTKGYKTICNHEGANMLDGIVTAFINKTTLWGKIEADYACLEIDEAYAQKVFMYFKPTKIIITNLFKDQLDRYGEADATIKMLKAAINKTPESCLILNGDDPMVAQFGYNRSQKTYYFGVEDDIETYSEKDQANKTQKAIKETYLCTICGNKLNYNYFHYNQLGDFYCSKCDFRREKLDFKANTILFGESIKFNMDSSLHKMPLDVPYKGFYNIYNILAAAATAVLLGIDTKTINKAFKTYTPELGRMETFYINKPVILNLSKNAAGFNQAIETMNKETKEKDLMIAINDKAQDGKDISWIWDINFECLCDKPINSYTICGIRKEDLALRLKYAGIKFKKVCIQEDILSAVKNTLAQTGKVSYILVNYTALAETQKVLKNLEQRASKNRKGDKVEGS